MSRWGKNKIHTGTQKNAIGSRRSPQKYLVGVGSVVYWADCQFEPLKQAMEASEP